MTPDGSMFPVLWHYRRSEQSLKRLAECGGLSPAELVAVIDGHGPLWVMHTTSFAQVPRLLQLLAAYTTGGTR